MANKIEQIASKKKAAQEKQDADVARFAKKVASEVTLGLSDSALIGSIAELATSVAEAVVNSNQNLDVSLKDNFSKLLSAVKDNPSNANQIELSKTIGTSLANVEQALTNMVLSPEINLNAISAEELRIELAAIVERLPSDTMRSVEIAYTQAHAGEYINVRLTDGFNFYRAGGGGGGAVVDTSALATSAKQDDIVQAIQGISGTTNKTTRIQTVGTRTYIGNAAIGSAESASVWQIKVLDTPGLTKLWADGNDNFDNVWDDRATVTYS